MRQDGGHRLKIGVKSNKKYPNETKQTRNTLFQQSSRIVQRNL
jgi:hypothetical protein